MIYKNTPRLAVASETVHRAYGAFLTAFVDNGKFMKLVNEVFCQNVHLAIESITRHQPSKDVIPILKDKTKT